MEWIIALLIKGVSMMGLVFVYYWTVYKGSLWIGRLIPQGPFKTFLFRERGRCGSGTGRQLNQ